MQPTPTPPPAPAPTRRRFRVVLALSLALNLLFIGLIAGAAWRSTGPGGPGARMAGVQNYATPYLRALPRADRRAIRNTLRRTHPELTRAARRARYAAMITALRAEPFDPSAVKSVLDAQAQLGQAVQATGQAELRARLDAMTPAQRRAYADSLQDRLDNRGNRGGRAPKDR